jgi:hypothetical protein
MCTTLAWLDEFCTALTEPGQRTSGPSAASQTKLVAAASAANQAAAKAAGERLAAKYFNRRKASASRAKPDAA